MSIREMMNQKKSLAAVGGASLVLLAIGIVVAQNWPESRAKLGMAYYTADDGKTWFEESTYNIAPFTHDGKEAVIAVVYSYANGSRKFCPYVAKYTPEAKKRLEAAIAEAKAKGLPPDSVALFRDRQFMATAMLYKKPGANNPWVRGDDPRALEVQSVVSPDGSELDQVFVY